MNPLAPSRIGFGQAGGKNDAIDWHGPGQRPESGRQVAVQFCGASRLAGTTVAASCDRGAERAEDGWRDAAGKPLQSRAFRWRYDEPPAAAAPIERQERQE